MASCAPLRDRLSSPDALEVLAPPARGALLEELLAALGSDWERGSASSPGVCVSHRPTAVEFALVPGGHLEMGLTSTDIARLAEHIELDRVEYSVEVDGASALPPRQVVVAPFLCARRPLAAGTMSREAAQAQVAAAGFRLPSEAELEWILRDGGREALVLGARPVPGRPGRFTFRSSRYGVEGLLIANWAADAWNPTYEGAPLGAEPWAGGEACGVCRSTFPLDGMETEEDIAVLLAALRAPGSTAMPAVARYVRGLPPG